MRRVFVSLFVAGLLVLAGTSTRAQRVVISDAQANSAGRRLWKNECDGKVEGLTSWNSGENFASLGHRPLHLVSCRAKRAVRGKLSRAAGLPDQPRRITARLACHHHAMPVEHSKRVPTGLWAGSGSPACAPCSRGRWRCRPASAPNASRQHCPRCSDRCRRERKPGFSGSSPVCLPPRTALTR